MTYGEYDSSSALSKGASAAESSVLTEADSPSAGLSQTYRHPSLTHLQPSVCISSIGHSVCPRGVPSLLSGWLVVFFVGATAAACSYVSIAVAIDIPASIRSSLVIAVLPRRGTCIEKQVPKLNLRTEIELMKECGEEWERKGFTAAVK